MRRINKKTKTAWIWAIAVLLLAGIAVAWGFLPMKEWTEAVQRWVDDLGVMGYVLFAAVYILGSLLLAPAAPLAVAAGVAFQGWGVPVVLASACAGACLAFLVARHVGRERLEALLEASPKFRAVDKAVSEEDWKVVLLLRLSPLVPFNVQNYLFGVTDVSLKHYMVATFVGIIPGTAKAVYLGMLGSGGIDDPLTWGLLAVGWIASAIAVVLIVRRAKAKLQRMAKS